MLNIALPTGRLGKEASAAFIAIGCTKELAEGDRRLIVEDEQFDLRFLLVKPSDVAMYVEHGAADIGVVGKDVLLETKPDIYELLDLGIGVCRMAVAAPVGWRDDTSRQLKVATTYTEIARQYYLSQGRAAEIIKLHGSVELAPLIGLADVIVDVVQTGTTLRENNLAVVAEIAPSSARLIANKSSYQFHLEQIERVKTLLEEQLK